MDVERADVQSRFRRLVRMAHPDHGAARDGAAERLAQLREARALLLATALAEAEAEARERTG
jgi:curved DNA-binding protein CbpA